MHTTLRYSLLLLLGACWVTSNEVGEKQLGKDTEDTDTDTDGFTLEILSVDPVSGSNGGGTEITIETTMLGEDLEVLLGDRVVQILDVTGNVITVSSPKTETAGWVPVEVRSGGAVAQLEDGFYLWPDGAGKTGVIGLLNYAKFYDSIGSAPTEEVSADIVFTQPTDFATFQYWAPGLDQCVSDYVPNVDGVLSFDVEADWITMKSGVHGVTLNAATDSLSFESDSLARADFIRGAKYDLQPIDSANAAWPQAIVPGFIRTPSAELTVTSPRIGDLSASISRRVKLRWEAANSAAMILVRIDRYSGTSLAETVTCALNDDGSYDISTSVFKEWGVGNQAFVLMGRAEESDATLPHNNSNSDVLGVQWVGGWVWML